MLFHLMSCLTLPTVICQLQSDNKHIQQQEPCDSLNEIWLCGVKQISFGNNGARLNSVVEAYNGCYYDVMMMRVRNKKSADFKGV